MQQLIHTRNILFFSFKSYFKKIVEAYLDGDPSSGLLEPDFSILGVQVVPGAAEAEAHRVHEADVRHRPRGRALALAPR